MKISIPVKQNLAHEPKFVGVLDKKNSVELVRCLNWYATLGESDDLCDTWLDQYVQQRYPKEVVKKLKHLRPSGVIIKKHCGMLARMEMNGTVFSGPLENIVDKKIKELITMFSEDVEESPEQPAVSVQQRIKQAAVKFIVELEDEIDTWFFEKNKSITFSMYSFLQKNKPSNPICNHIKEFIESKLQELQLAANNKDEQLVEGFSYLSKKRIKEILNNFNNIIDDISRYCQNTKVSKPRKPRQKKIVSIDKQINKIKYQKEFSSLKIKSIEPSQIIGASQLWVFNTKTNQITCFICDTPNLSIKGTTIQNFNEKLSIKKKVRKPKEMLDLVLTGGKPAISKALSNLKTKAAPANGRINEDTILLRVLR